jgi:sigma-54 dependent transcriptional regulator, acetoin dehydrogenase operon transcriptional activator AcoR
MRNSAASDVIPSASKPVRHADRTTAIESRRRAVILEGFEPARNNWLEQSWLRCMSAGQHPDSDAVFQVATRALAQNAIDEQHQLIQAAKPVMMSLAKTIANTQYFAVLTDSLGVVLDAQGDIDRSDRRASQITTTGIDLSERSIGTTAIGAALSECKPVWLHQGEHFLSSNRIYSCAGAPIFGLNNTCVGMLDLTGIEVPERRELVHLAVRSAKNIQNSLLRQEFFGHHDTQLLQIQWSGVAFDNHSDGLIAISSDGQIQAFNQAACDWLPTLATQVDQSCEDLFAMTKAQFFDQLNKHPHCVTLALWSGLQISARWSAAETAIASEAPIKTVQAELIRRAMRLARGNVASAAKALGISRATLYRKLHHGPSTKG